MKIWAYEVCYCRYETGYQIQSLHKTKEGAEKVMNSKEERRRQKYTDGHRVAEWHVQN